MRFNNILMLFIPVLFLVACGGGGSDGKTTTPVNTSTGIFIDGPVAGLQYRTASQSGITNSAGEYKYLPGETVTFSIGDIVLGNSLAAPVLTPLSLVPGASGVTDPVVTNIVRLLMTLDEDADASNGISISSAVNAAAKAQSVDFNSADLARDPGMIQLLAGLPGNPVLVDAKVAQLHFAGTLGVRSNWGTLVWGTGNWQGKSP